MALPTTPSPPTAHEEPQDRRAHPPLSAMRLVALTLLTIVALAGAVAAAVALPEGAPGTFATSVLELVAFACGLTVAASLLNRRSRTSAARPGPQITFPPPGSVPMAREPRSLAPAGVAAAIAAVALAATFALDRASRHASEAACSGTIDPQACRNDANFPLALLGALFALVFVAATIASFVVWLGRRRDLRAARRPPEA